MAVDKDNIRIMVTITREENEILKEMAKKENRSVSNLVGTLVKKYLESDTKTPHNSSEPIKIKKVLKKSLFEI